LEHQERNNIRNDQGAILEDIVVAGANRSFAITFWRPLWSRNWPNNNDNLQKSWTHLLPLLIKLNQ